MQHLQVLKKTLKMWYILEAYRTENRTWVDNTADQKVEEFASLLIVFFFNKEFSAHFKQPVEET